MQDHFMLSNNFDEATHFSVVGISYQKADAHTRGKFSLNDEARQSILQKAHILGLRNCLVISTCNRTEVYLSTDNKEIIYQLISENAQGDINLLKEVSFHKNGQDAIQHFFRVGCGLESQILGDFEIIGQVKTSYQQSISTIGKSTFLDRLVNTVIQTSKRIKSNTQLSSGATSVSFAGVHYLRKNLSNISEHQILLYGTGKLGRNTCQNLVKHTNHSHITLINRTSEKAESLGKKLHVKVEPIDNLNSEINNSDIIFVATGAQKPTITKAQIKHDKKLLIFDLSIPENVDQDVEELPNVTVIRLDELSKLTDDTLDIRKKHLPEAERIINEHLSEFNNWIDSRKIAPTLKALNTHLKGITDSELNKLTKELNDEHQASLLSVSDVLVQKITNQIAHHLRNRSQELEKELSTIHSIFQLRR